MPPNRFESPADAREIKRTMPAKRIVSLTRINGIWTLTIDKKAKFSSKDLRLVLKFASKQRIIDFD